MSTEVEDLYDWLIAVGIAGGTTGWDVLRRRVMDEDVADQLITIREDGGPQPEIPADQGVGDSAMADRAVHIRVRAEEWDGDASRNKLAEIEQALHGQRNITMGSRTYMRVIAQSAAVFVGFDESARPIHTQSYLFLSAL